jgi:hypothetical protein
LRRLLRRPWTTQHGSSHEAGTSAQARCPVNASVYRRKPVQLVQGATIHDRFTSRRPQPHVLLTAPMPHSRVLPRGWAFAKGDVHRASGVRRSVSAASHYGHDECPDV